MAAGASLAGFGGTAITTELGAARGLVLLLGLAMTPLLLLAALAPTLAIRWLPLLVDRGRVDRDAKTVHASRPGNDPGRGQCAVAAARRRRPLPSRLVCAALVVHRLLPVGGGRVAIGVEPVAVRQTVRFWVELLFATLIVTVCWAAAEAHRVFAPLLIVAAGIAVITPIGWSAPEIAHGGALVLGTGRLPPTQRGRGLLCGNDACRVGHGPRRAHAESTPQRSERWGAPATASPVMTRRDLPRAGALPRSRDAALLARPAAAMVAVVAQGILAYSLRSSVIFTTVTGVLAALLALAGVLNRR